jgi:hypothetical protein
MNTIVAQLRRSLWIVALCFALAALASPMTAAGADLPPAPQPQTSSPGGQVLASLSFAPLPDAYAGGTRYEAQGLSGRFTFDRDGYSLTMNPRLSEANRDGKPAAVAMRFEGRAKPVIIPGRLLSGAINDTRGSDPTLRRTGAPTYETLTYRQLYRGIDLQYEGLPGRFKGTYIVAPGADPGLIRWRFVGATSVEIHRVTGELWVELPERQAGYLIEGAPLVWQEVGTRKVIVPARYEMDGDGVLRYALGAYDPTRPLVIDPVVSYAP